MSYEQNGPMHLNSVAITITGSAADSTPFIQAPAAEGLRLLEVGYVISTLVVAAGTTAGVISYDLADANGTANRTELKNFTPEDNASLAVNAGETYNFVINGYPGGYPIPNGHRVVFEHKTAAAGGSAAGAVVMWAKYKYAGESI